MAPIKVYYFMAMLLLGSECFAQTDKDTTNENLQSVNHHDSEKANASVVNLKEKPDDSMNKLKPIANKYTLYTRSNPTEPQLLAFNDDASVHSSNFNSSEQTVVIVHGWEGSHISPINPTVRNAILEKMNANVIVVDWGLLASRNYATAAGAVPGVGTDLGQFLAFLNQVASASYNQMHLVGFSLGAHVVGNAGNYLNGKVARITGLDPAGPLWGPLNPKRLTAANAVYVEAIHTDRNVLGTGYRSGDVDFYPNGGILQPGCLAIDLCSHERSWQLFAATVTLNHLVGRKCNGEINTTFNSCVGDSLPMGNTELFKNGNGQYALKTSSKYPYTQIN